MLMAGHGRGGIGGMTTNIIPTQLNIPSAAQSGYVLRIAGIGRRRNLEPLIKPLSPASPYMAARIIIAEYGDKPPVQRFVSIELIKSALLRTRGVWGGTPTPVAHVLLVAVRRTTPAFRISSQANGRLLKD